MVARSRLLVARGHVIADRRRVVCAMTYFPRLTRPSAAPSCVVHERCARQNCVSCNLLCRGPCPRWCRARGCGSSRRFYFRIRTSNVLVSCSTGTVLMSSYISIYRMFGDTGRPATAAPGRAKAEAQPPSRSLNSPISAVDEHRRVRYRRQSRFWSLRDLLLDRGAECEA